MQVVKHVICNVACAQVPEGTLSLILTFQVRPDR